jgi:hypothetical protein
VIFLAYSYLITHINANADAPFFYGAAAVAIGSVLPDFLEPSTSWTHRGFFHSNGALAFTFIAFIVTALIGVVFGLFLLPFASKIKILGFEFERVKEAEK